MWATPIRDMQIRFLTGSDLIQFSPIQLLTVQFEKDNESLQNGCDLAYSEVIGSLSTRYNITSEFQVVSGARCILLVKITAIIAIRNILGNLQNISQVLKDTYEWADNTILDIRNGQMNLILDESSVAKTSGAMLIPNSFLTLG